MRTRVLKKVMAIMLTLALLSGMVPGVGFEVRPADANTATLNPTADTFQDSLVWTGNIGGNGDDANIAPRVVNWVGNMDGTFENAKAAIKFDLSSITGTVTDAKLKLYISYLDNSSGPVTFNLSSSTDDTWLETSTSLPALATTLLSGVAVSGTDQWIELDVTAFINSEVSGNQAVSFVLTGASSGTQIFAFCSDEDSTYKPQLNVTYNPKSASIAYDSAMTESNLDARYIEVNLSGESFADNTLTPGNFTLLNPPAGLTVESVDYISSTHAHVNLAFDGRDFDSNSTNLGLTIKATELAGGADLTASNNLTITATNDPESISIADDGNISEGQEDGEVITVTLSGGTFSSPLTPANWTVTGLPAGVTKGTVTRNSATQASITLSGNATSDYDTNITHISVSCTTAEYKDASGGGSLSDNTGVTLTANTSPTVTTDASVTAITATSATVSGNVTSDGRLALSARGVEYKKTSDGSYTAVPAVGTATGVFSVNLTGLEPATSYNVKAYATNSEGTSYGAVVTFLLPAATAPGISSITATNAGANQGLGIGDTVAITFDQNTNKPAITAATIDAKLKLNNGHSWGAALQNADIAWNGAGNILTITFSDITNSTIAVGDTITLDATANIKDAAASSAASTDSDPLTGTFTSVAAINSITASNAGNNLGLGIGDTVAITFDQNTNKPAITAATIDAKLQLNNGHSWGSALQNADIAWNGAGNILTITFSSVTNSTIAVGDTITLDAIANIKDTAETTAASTDSDSLTGTFTDIIAPTAAITAGTTAGGDALVNAAEKAAGFNVVAQSSEATGTLYVVPSGTASTIGGITGAAIGSAASAGANTDTTIAISAENAGVINGTTYKVYAVDVAGNISVISGVAFTADLIAPTATITAGTTAGGDALVNIAEKAAGFNVVAQSSEAAGTLYVVPSGTANNIGAITGAAIGSAASAGANTDTTIAITAGNAGVINGTTYKVYAVDAAGNISVISGVAFTADLTSPLASFTPITLSQTGDVANSNVQYGNAAAVIGALPTTVAVTLVNGSVVTVPITWSDTDTYTAGTAAAYTFTATWGAMPAGANDNNSLAAPTVEVTVAQGTSPLASFTPITLTQTGDVANSNVQYGNAAAVIGALPTTVAVTLVNGWVVNVPVTWSDTDTYTAGTAAAYTFTATWGAMPAGANDNNSLAAPTVEVTVAAGGGSTGNSGGHANTDTEILVNGDNVSAGDTKNTVEDGKTVTTVIVDEAKLEQKLKTAGKNAVITIPVKTDSDMAIGELNGQMVKSMENKEGIVEIKTDTATYTLPARQINIDAVSEQMGTNVVLKDIKVLVEIVKTSAGTAALVENAAKKGQFTIIAPPVEFNVRCTYGAKTVNVSKFNAYVERTVVIPAGVDPSKITTGVIVDPDGTVRHVPTKVVIIGGKYYAKINSLTNSTYSVVWNPITFKDAEKHWAKAEINDMGSRMVISGVGNGMFEPDRDITRAEFAAIVVRSLGLKPGTGNNAFKDVKTADWYIKYIETANEYGIIEGYDKTRFGPLDKITREQAMTMIARAMKLTGLKVEFKAEEVQKLFAEYVDSKQASAWAKDNIATCVKAGIVAGKSRKTLAPKDEITRAEVAAIVEKLLQKSSLI